MDWFEIIHEPFIDLIKAVFILAAYAFGTYLSTIRRKKWEQYVIGVVLVAMLSFGMLTNLGGGKIIDGPDLFSPGGIRDKSDILAGYPSDKEKAEFVLRIFFTYAPPTILGIFFGNRNKRIAP
jgi:hypothetical protein